MRLRTGHRRRKRFSDKNNRQLSPAKLREIFECVKSLDALLRRRLGLPSSDKP